MVLARLRQLAAHEVGHTLGLQHNYAASPVNRASVMDYPAPFVKLGADGVPDLSDAYAQRNRRVGQSRDYLRLSGLSCRHRRRVVRLIKYSATRFRVV